jgi:hypothetical protein
LQALLAAAERGHAGACALLLEHGADVNAQRRGGQTPLFAACVNGFGSVVAALLVKWKADPTLARDADGATCLHVVTQRTLFSREAWLLALRFTAP